ncbi:MAG: hypothetical protein D3917_03285 [Candidatus Electrothrix sp. AX5]|nr:hypothetical protein [Candidatus Electrothrix sp. AX5]
MKEIPIKQYLIRGGAWAFAGRVLTAFMGFILFALLTRLLSPEDMGVYFLAFNLATFFSIFASFGLENTLLRFVAEAIGCGEFTKANSTIKKILFLAFLSSTATILLYFTASSLVFQYFFTSNALGEIKEYIAIWLLLLTFQKIFSEVFRAAQDIRMAIFTGGLFTSIASVFFLTLYLLTKKNHTTLPEVLLWILSAGILNIVFSCWGLSLKIRWLPDTAPRKKKDIDGVGYGILVAHSWPLFINAIMTFFLSQSSIWVVGTFCSAHDLAIYGAVSRLVLFTGITLSIVNAIVPPMIAHLNVQNKKKQLEKVLQTTATLSALPSLVILSVYLFCDSWILSTLFGDFYRTGGSILIILSIGQLVNIFVGSCGYTLIMMGYRRTIMFISTFSTIIALSISFILVKNHGTIGVAIAYTTGMIVQQLLMLLATRYQCGIWTHASFRALVSFNS